MSATTTIPVTITPDAQARVEELGRQAEFAEMIERVRTTVPGLVAIEVERYIRYDDSSPPGVAITGRTTMDWKDSLAVLQALDRWFIQRFEAEVRVEFLITLGYEVT